MDNATTLASLCENIELELKVKIKNFIMENVKKILNEIILLGCAPSVNNDNNNIVTNIKQALKEEISILKINERGKTKII